MKTPSQTPPIIPVTGYIRRFRLPEMLGVSMATIDRWVKKGVLPRPVRLTSGTTAFNAVDIQNWLSDRKAAE